MLPRPLAGHEKHHFPSAAKLKLPRFFVCRCSTFPVWRRSALAGDLLANRDFLPGRLLHEFERAGNQLVVAEFAEIAWRHLNADVFARLALRVVPKHGLKGWSEFSLEQPHPKRTARLRVVDQI